MENGECCANCFSCNPIDNCFWRRATITLTNITNGPLTIRQEEGLKQGAPPAQVPNGDNSLTHGNSNTVEAGRGISFGFLNKAVECDEYYVCDVSYAPGYCPTPSPSGYGSCSIADILLQCSMCPSNN